MSVSTGSAQSDQSVAGQLGELSAITEGDLRSLIGCGRRLCMGDTISPEDLVQEALARTCVGDREWRPDLPLRVQLLGTMKSVLSAWRKARMRNPHVAWDDAVDELCLDDIDTDLVQNDADYESRIQSELDQLEAEFADDEPARDLVQALLLGFDYQDLEDVTGLTSAQVAAARKRISRRLAASAPREN